MKFFITGCITGQVLASMIFPAPIEVHLVRLAVSVAFGWVVKTIFGVITKKNN